MKKSSTILSIAAITCATGVLAATATLTFGLGSGIPTAHADNAHTVSTQTAYERTLENVATINRSVPPEGSILQAVEDKRDIRCYFQADLNTEYPSKEDPAVKMPPFITTGIMDVGFDAKNNPNPQDRNAGMLQINDPVKACAALWDTGDMNPNGITDNLIPQGFVAPKPVMVPSDPRDHGPDGKPFPDQLVSNVPGHYIPSLAECVVDNVVAVIPGSGDVCAKMGVPVLKQ
ncbi:hypothetical protein [Arthrobacter cryoconiti]|uniref:Secreted protein n=1 Tax=Arthrobacter cryoconiti TaxID=748907 RepID=A0ABV8QVT4_9MICC|nr:hypothetical protein [Arthrobacter cryoconiti]MCC9069556.1 hypothetical protein [Arthrobacter cryoconiti]